MSIKYFDNTDVLINNSGVLASNASITSKNNIRPIQTIGRVGSSVNAPSGPIEHIIRMNYAVQLGHEPNYGIVTGLKVATDTTGYSPTILEVNGVTGFGFLNQYNLTIEPNNVTTASAEYVSYFNLSGDFRDQVYSGNYGDFDKVGHGWTTYLTQGQSYSESPVYSLSYSFRADWEPVYTLGRKEPSQVLYLGGEETLSIEKDDYTHIKFSGEKSEDFFSSTTVTGLDMISLDVVGTSEYDVSANPNTGVYTHLIINLSGMYLNNSSIKAQLNDFLRNSLEFSKAY
jgi:hypothetical protein